MWNLDLNQAFHKIKEWDKEKAEWFQKKFNLSDYQMLWIVFGKGFIIGALLL
tara:strand:+ start:2304 stop:2459 length:156 start_codon:yes stop_codon:yes gene_type:complete